MQYTHIVHRRERKTSDNNADNINTRVLLRSVLDHPYNERYISLIYHVAASERAALSPGRGRASPNYRDIPIYDRISFEFPDLAH